MNAGVPREQWSGRAAFVLVAVGSAVGLGNIWRFSYVAGENGDGAFLFIYLVAVAALGLPLMLSKFALGRGARSGVKRSRAWLALDAAVRRAGHPRGDLCGQPACGMRRRCLR